MKRTTAVLSLLLLSVPFTVGADVVVDNSPDGTGVMTFNSTFGAMFPGQYVGDRFTLVNDTVITGGAIFSSSAPMFSIVGTPVVFVVLPDEGGVPGNTPVINEAVLLDAVDNVLTTRDPGMLRKHATIPPHLLPAGDYWFYMAGDGSQLMQGTGHYDDNVFYFGEDANPDLERGAANVGNGDTFFTIEGDSAVTAHACAGFYSPMEDYPVKAKKNRVFPLKMELFDGDGFELEGSDLAAAPVLQVIYRAVDGITALDVSSDALSAGAGSEGNQFAYTSDGIWQFNLKSRNYSSNGEYMLTAVSGDDAEYVIDPACVTSFLIE